MAEKRYYYRSIDYKEWFDLREPKYKGNENYIELTEEQWHSHLRDIGLEPALENEGE